MYLDAIDQASDGVNGFRLRSLILQQCLQFPDLSAIEFADIWMDLDVLPERFRCELVLQVLLACLEIAQRCGNGAGITPMQKLKAA